MDTDNNESRNLEINVSNAWNQTDGSNAEEKEDSSTIVDNKILRMMNIMGYQSGFGLGKNKQGIVEPITVQRQFRRQGLGLKIENLQYTDEQWDFSLDNPTLVENVNWLHTTDLLPTDMEGIMTGMKEDKPCNNIEEEYNFCDKETLSDVLAAKNIFNELDLKDLCQARAKANPFETIRAVFFMNRASLKMANIDAATGFMFTNINENPYHKDNPGPYYFADVCAGPGGFTEYILWRKSWQFKGFGFTLRGDNDFKLTNSICTSPVTFLPLYGAQGDGNVCSPENIDDFKEKVLFETRNEGVHFMMSDGGFSVEGNENIQEILSKNIYVCQCLVALEILRKHGHFVTKVFDMFTCFSVGLFYLMCKSFEKVCILKPNSSRPANSERYVICSNYAGREHVQNIVTYLRKIVDKLWELKDEKDLDVTEIVPLSVLKNDSNFYSYIFNSNNRIAKSQTINLQKLAIFCRNPSLIDHRQEELRSGCLKYWQIPDKPRVPLSKYTVDDLLSETVHNAELLLCQSREISSFADFGDILNVPQDWHYVPMQCQKKTNICNFYAGVGSSKVYRLQSNKWTKVKNIQLTRGTLLYGELVKEKIVSKNSADQVQQKYSLHVIDALRLGDLSLADLDFEERNKMICMYCESINHEFRTSILRVRAKIMNRFDKSVGLCFPKNEISANYISQLPILGFNVEKEFFEVNSILILKTNKDQSFHTTYFLRRQLFLNELKFQNETFLSLELVINVLKNMET